MTRQEAKDYFNNKQKAGKWDIYEHAIKTIDMIYDSENCINCKHLNNSKYCYSCKHSHISNFEKKDD